LVTSTADANRRSTPLDEVFGTHRVQYGPGVLAHAANLTCANYVPVGRAARLLSDTLGVVNRHGFDAASL
jgi:hypothetical protein